MNIRNTRLFWFLKNICVFWRCDLYKEIAELKAKQIDAQKNLMILKNREMAFEIMMYHDVHSDNAQQYQEELQYLYNNGLSVFPYEKIKFIESVVSGFDNNKQMPWVLHNQKRLYFPARYTKEQAISTYRNFIETENILGGNYRTKSPHQYQTELFKIENGDVFVDVGCAEGLVALDVIEKVKKVYLIESDSIWIPAIEATFAPYKEKTVIVNKLVSAIDSTDTITLSTLLKAETESSLFIKMDIEGYETDVVESSKLFLMEHKNVKLACCTYHKENDERVLQSYGYKTCFSDGFMLFILDNLRPPYFRKGVIRAYKN